MKMFNKLLVSLFLVSLMAAGATACEPPAPPASDDSSSSNSEVVTPPTYTFSLTADKTTATVGDTVTLTAVLLADGEEVALEEEVKYEIIEGTAHATLKGNVLTISSSAKANAVIKVWAKLGATKSDIVEIKVDIPLEGIAADANNVTNVESGGMVILNKTITPTNADASAFKWVILEGEDVCTIANDILTVNTGVATGTKIQVQGQLGDKTTETLTFTVGYPVESVKVSVDLTENVVAGETVILHKEILPAKADKSDFEWVVLEGEGKFTINGDVLTVNAGVATGTVIKLQGKAGGVLSEDVITISVGFPVESVSISADVKNIESGSSITLSKEILPAKADKTGFEWIIVEGQNVCSIVDDKLTVNEGVATGTTIKVQGKIEGQTSNVLTFTVGYPVESVTIYANGITNILSGQFVVLSKEILPAKADQSDFEWMIVDGEGICSFDGNKLTVNEGVATGETITVQAKVGGKVSDPITFTVGYPVTELKVTLNGSANIPQGGFVDLVVTPNPSNATNADYTWAFVEGGEFCTIDENNRLTVSEDTPLGTEITFYADGAVDSTVVSIIVDVAITDLTIASNAPANLVKGESYNITLTAEPSNASTKFVEWVVNEEAQDYVTIANGVMTVAANAPTGLDVTVKAINGAVESNPLSYIVGIVLESLSVNMSGTRNVDPGDSRELFVTYSPENATDKVVTWMFDAGEDSCTIVGKTLTVDADAEIGTEITFYAQIGSVTSAPITIIVGTPIESIVISADKENIIRGNSATLSAVVNPSNATNSYTWEITQGADCVASFENNVLVVKDAAEVISNIIKVKAVSSTAESNELTFKILPKQEDIDADYEIIPSKTSFEIDKYDNSTPPVLEAQVLFNEEPVANPVLKYNVTEGSEYLDISVNNNICTFIAKGHGLATIEISVTGTGIVVAVQVNVIVPPDFIYLPEMFSGVRSNYEYNFSKVDALPYAVSAIGTNVCQDIDYTFTAADGTSGDAVATYADGKITFKQTGKITVTATSASGSDKLVSQSYTFNINEGINVYNFEQLKKTIESSSYTGEQAINFVALNKLDGDYKFVPAVILEGRESWATLGTNHWDKKETAIVAQGKGLYINGNHHAIDMSKMRALTKDEVIKGAADAGLTSFGYNIGSVFNVLPRDNEGKIVSYKVKLYDLELKGNAPVDFAGDLQDTTAKPIGVHLSGISIGNNDERSGSNYNYGKYIVDMKNIRISGFNHGLSMRNVASGMIDTIYAGNCYADGILCASSIVTLRNVTFGICGATGIELAPERHDKAGLNEDQQQTITFDGTIDGNSNWHAADSTRYFQNYKVGGLATVPEVVNGNVSMYTAMEQQHLMKGNQFCFVALLFNDLSPLPMGSPIENTTKVNYPSHLAGGIRDLNPLDPSDDMTAIDTTHQYIRIPIYATIPGKGMIHVGAALFYNAQYQG